MNTRCFICGNDKALSYYSPKTLYKYNIIFCNKCIKLLFCEDLEYISQSNNNEFAKSEINKIVQKKGR